MANLPSNRNLLIPGKNALGSSYTKDAQTLETWARQPIQQLTAGSGITLSPSSGLAVQNGRGPYPVEISASGGGGKPGLATLQGGPDPLLIGNFVSLGPISIAFLPAQVKCQVWSGSSAYPAGVDFDFVISWFVISEVGVSVNTWPLFAVPFFTGPNIGIAAYMSAADATFTNFYFLQYAGTHVFTSGSSYQTVETDWTVVNNAGADLSLVPGTGGGTGIVSAGGAASGYWCAVNMQVVIQPSTVVTPF